MAWCACKVLPKKLEYTSLESVALPREDKALLSNNYSAYHAQERFVCADLAENHAKDLSCKHTSMKDLAYKVKIYM